MLTAIILSAHLFALGEIEGGSDDVRKTGRFGEITRFQILPCELHNFGYKESDVANYATAKAVIKKIWQKKIGAFEELNLRLPTTQEMYLIWHRPARVFSPSNKEKDRAQRFANLVESQTKKTK